MPQENEGNKNNKYKIIIGAIVCILVIAYLIYQAFTYFGSSTVSLYQVSAGSTESAYESQYTALVLREETVVYSASSGYVNFFVGDSTPVSVGEETYLIDEDGNLYEQLSESAQSLSIFDDEDLLKIKNSIYDFDTSFDIDNYSDVYSFKSKLESQLLDTIYSSVFESASIDLSSYNIYSTDISGIMVHSVDGFENISADSMEASYFRKANYEKTVITSNDYIEQGSPVYKIVTSEEWQLVIQIEDASAFEDISSVEIEFLKDGITASCDFYMYTSAGNTYGVFSLDKYMYRYVSDRYLQISIANAVQSGLKIPKSSLAVEQYYIVPADYLTTGGNSSSSGLLVRTETESGTSVQFLVPDIVKETDEYIYISTDFLSEGDIIVQSETNETYTVRIKENIEGVYVWESGSYSFCPVNILGENGDYYIVEKQSSSSVLKLYDNIAANAESVSD